MIFGNSTAKTAARIISRAPTATAAPEKGKHDKMNQQS